MPAAGLVLSKKSNASIQSWYNLVTQAGFTAYYSSMEALLQKKSRLLTLFTSLYQTKRYRLFLNKFLVKTVSFLEIFNP